MSRKLLAVAAFALIAPVAVAHSQVSLGIAAGASMPTGTTSDNVDMGYHVMGTVAIMPPLAPVGFRVDGSFNEFNFKAPATGTKLRVMSLTANAVFSAPGVIVLSPYLIGGLGMYNTALSPKPTINGDASNDLGFNVGAGVKFGLAGFGAFAEARYHQITDGGPRFVPITFGIIF